MTKTIRHALLLGAAVLLSSATLALAHMDGPMPPDGPMQGLLHRDRLSDRLLKEYDANRDGRITRAEYNNVIGTRFAAATHRGSGMTAEQFTAMHQGDFQQHAGAMFRRADWNGDGRLTLDEFAAPQRARFQMMDREGAGTVSCARSGPGQFGRGGVSGRGPRGFGGGFAMARFCGESDQSRDGKVTRAEFDSTLAKHFQTATNGAPAMMLATFAADQNVRFRDMNERMFARLDRDDDGLLTLAEFAAPPLKLFDRLDRNHDRTLSVDEMKPRTRGRDGDS